MIPREPGFWIVASGLATALGAPAVLLLRRPSPRSVDALLGFTAGVMLAASVFSLLVPALDLGSVGTVVAWILAGALVVALADTLLPHLHMLASTRRGEHAGPTTTTSRHTGALVLVAMVIHNVPEGLAVGVAFAAGGPSLGVPIAVAIAVQNIPEGFVSGALLAPTIGHRRAALVAAASGLVEIPAAAIAYWLTGGAQELLAPGLAFAAGAMLYVVVDELVPEQQVRGNERIATFGLLIGFCFMLALDNGLS